MEQEALGYMEADGLIDEGTLARQRKLRPGFLGMRHKLWQERVNGDVTSALADAFCFSANRLVEYPEEVEELGDSRVESQESGLRSGTVAA